MTALTTKTIRIYFIFNYANGLIILHSRWNVEGTRHYHVSFNFDNAI